MIKKSFTDEKLSNYADICMSYLVSDANILAQFMDFAGYDPNQLRNSVGSKAMAMALMEYFAKNEPALLAMCANSAIEVKDFMNFWQNQNHS